MLCLAAALVLSATAERFIAMYAKQRSEARFVVVDLDRPSAAQRLLVERFYRGAVPTVALLDRSGKPVYGRAGETPTKRGDIARLEEILRSAR